MTPKRTRSGMLQFELDWKSLGIRINRSSETKNLREYRGLVALLWQLRHNGQTDVLRAFASGQISIADLKQAQKTDRLKSDSLLSDMAVHRPLWSAIEDTLPKMGKSEATRGRYYTSLRKLRRLSGLPASAKVEALSSLDWKALRTRWEGSEADWNHLRRAVSSFLTQLMGDVFHPFRRAVVKRIPREDEGSGREPDIDVDRFLEIVARTPDHAKPCYWTLALTGMRVESEYLRCREKHMDPHAFTVDIPGRKTGRSSQAKVEVDPAFWHWIELGVPAPLQINWMRKYFKRAVREMGLGHLMLRDLRHTFAQIASDEGVPTALIQGSMRHRDPRMTRRYEMRKGKGQVAAAIGRAFKRRTG